MMYGVMAKQRRFVIGDIHGANRALLQCLERSGFDTEKDLLISLGDLCDRWPEVDKVFDTLLGIKNLVLLLGNHDHWALEWFINRKAPEIWLMQGGDVTMNAYRQGIPESHILLLSRSVLYHHLDNKLFVHGGFDPELDITAQDRETLLWDRSLIRSALLHKNLGLEKQLTSYQEVYVGHTPTLNFGETEPIKACEVYLMDTGAGWPEGVLTMMDIDSKEIWQSDPVERLYNI
jgi:serine/threonine protein phosphatase 1